MTHIRNRILSKKFRFLTEILIEIVIEILIEILIEIVIELLTSHSILTKISILNPSFDF